MKRSVGAPDRFRRMAPWLLAAAGTLVYLNSFAGVFLFDDQRYVIDNEKIRDLGALKNIVSRDRRPVFNLSLAINYAFGKKEPWGYHLVNLLVHLAAGLTLFGVVRRTLDHLPRSQPPASHRTVLAFAVAVLWIVHPLQTQSVTYIVQRCEAMMGLFYLLTLYCVIRGAGGGRPGAIWFVTAVISCALGMGCKEVMVTAPVVVFLYDCVFLARSPWSALERRWGLYVGLCGTWIILPLVGTFQSVLLPVEGASSTVGFGFTQIHWMEYLRTQFEVILRYLLLAAAPVRLCLDYGWRVEHHMPIIAGTGTVILLMAAATVFGLVRRRWWGFAGAWFFLILLPTSSFIPIKDLAFEHRMYLSLAAPIALLVGGAYWVIEALRRDAQLPSVTAATVAWGLLVMCVAALGARTMRRNRDYHSQFAMWSNVVEQRPENARAHNMLGLALVNEKDQIDEGIRHYETAIQLNPKDYKAYSNLGVALAKKHEFQRAVDCYRAALAIRPGQAEVMSNLGAALERLGKTDEAATLFQEARGAAKQPANIEFNMGMILEKQGKLDQAVQAFARALDIEPTNDAALQGMDRLLTDRRRASEAAPYFERALAADADNATALRLMGKLLGMARRYDEAAAFFERAKSAAPQDVNVYLGQGKMLIEAKRLKQAIEILEVALKLSPDSVQALSNLAVAKQRSGRFAESERLCRRAIEIDPKFIDARINLAGVLVQERRMAEAIDEYRAAHRIAPLRPEEQLFVADLLEKQGRWSEAGAEYEDLLKRHPDHAGARRRLTAVKQKASGDKP